MAQKLTKTRMPGQNPLGSPRATIPPPGLPGKPQGQAKRLAQTPLPAAMQPSTPPAPDQTNWANGINRRRSR
jgi:hypothetical protein